MAFHISKEPDSFDAVLAYASELEQALGEIVNGERKADMLPLQPIAGLIQFARGSTSDAYELTQDDMMVACTYGANALAEIKHYAAQYSQDGPVQIFRVTRTEIHG